MCILLAIVLGIHGWSFTQERIGSGPNTGFLTMHIISTCLSSLVRRVRALSKSTNQNKALFSSDFKGCSIPRIRQININYNLSDNARVVN